MQAGLNFETPSAGVRFLSLRPFRTVRFAWPPQITAIIGSRFRPTRSSRQSRRLSALSRAGPESPGLDLLKVLIRTNRSVTQVRYRTSIRSNRKTNP
jgi:hypothetical protein